MSDLSERLKEMGFISPSSNFELNLDVPALFLPPSHLHFSSRYGFPVNLVLLEADPCVVHVLEDDSSTIVYFKYDSRMDYFNLTDIDKIRFLRNREMDSREYYCPVGTYLQPINSKSDLFIERLIELRKDFVHIC